MPFSPGTTVGPYQIIEQLGAGGMATVYKAYHPALDRDVAIKVLHPAFKNDPQFFVRFQREARIVARLEHPNIVPVYDFNEFEGEPYLVMRFVNGETLKASMQNAPFDAATVLRLMEPVCDALAYAHRQGILHRDIKPSNIILADNGHVFLTDFGLARMAELGESTLSQDMLVGTPQYISPEQAQGQGNIDGRTDIYALGVVLFEMVTGRVPYSGDTPFAIIHDHIYKPLPLPSSLNEQVSERLEKVVLRALAKNPDDRFSTMEEFWQALKKALTPSGSAATVVRPVPPPETTVEKKAKKKWSKKKIALVAAGALISLFLCVAIITSQPDETAAPPADVPPVEQSAGQTTDSLPPQNPEVEKIVNDGINLLKEDNPEEAIDRFQQAIDTDPHYMPAYLYGAMTGLRYDDSDLARNFAEQAVANNAARPEVHALAGYIFTRTEDTARAKDEFQRALDIAPDYAPAYAGLARIALIDDDPGLARDMLDEAEKIAPDSPEVKLVEAEYQFSTGKKRLALVTLRNLAQQKNMSPLLRDELRFVFETVGENPPPALNP